MTKKTVGIAQSLDNGHYPKAVFSSDEEAPEVIGTVKGPGETSNQYVFITSNTQAVRVGDFVYYEVQDTQSQTLKILGKIRQVQLLDHIPDRIFADTEIDPSTIVALVGFTHPNPEIYAVTVEVIGYFHRAMGFINPRRPPDPGAKVFLASNRLLKSILNKRDETAVGGAHLGSLLLRDEGAVPVAQDGGGNDLLLFLANLVHLQNGYLPWLKQILGGQVFHIAKVGRAIDLL